MYHLEDGKASFDDMLGIGMRLRLYCTLQCGGADNLGCHGYGKLVLGMES